MSEKTVELSGAVMLGVCDVKLNECVAASSPQAVYAVWERPSGQQIAVCGACLTEMLKSGRWRQALPPQPKLDLESLRHAVQWAATPQNQGTRAEMIAFLQKEIAAVGQHSNSTIETLRGWLKQLEVITGE